MSSVHKRLLIQLEKAMREVNRDTLNPLFEELTPGDILPITELVAKARGDYIHELFNLSQLPQAKQKLSTDLVKSLRFKRLIYEELLGASKALDKAIERGYLDVEH